MPSSNHETTVARQWELLRNHLPSRQPGRSASDIRERLESAGHKVTKRTVERDLSELSRIFPIQRNEISQPYGWHWTEGRSVEIPGMDLAEAVSLGLLENVMRQIMPPAFISALEGKFFEAQEKLAALSTLPHARWSDLVRYVPPGLPFQPPALAPGVLPAIQEALLWQRQLRVIYAAAGSDGPKELVLHPLAMIQQGSRPYLLASAFAYPAPRLFAIQRIADATLLEESVERPSDYSLDAFLNAGGTQFGNGDSIVLKARITETLARLIDETPLSPDQKITLRSDVRSLTATVRNSWQLFFWILSQGSHITVLKPVSLRKEIIANLEANLAAYQKS